MLIKYHATSFFVMKALGKLGVFLLVISSFRFVPAFATDINHDVAHGSSFGKFHVQQFKIKDDVRLVPKEAQLLLQAHSGGFFTISDIQQVMQSIRTVYAESGLGYVRVRLLLKDDFDDIVEFIVSAPGEDDPYTLYYTAKNSKKEKTPTYEDESSPVYVEDEMVMDPAAYDEAEGGEVPDPSVEATQPQYPDVVVFEAVGHESKAESDEAHPPKKVEVEAKPVTVPAPVKVEDKREKGEGVCSLVQGDEVNTEAYKQVEPCIFVLKNSKTQVKSTHPVDENKEVKANVLEHSLEHDDTEKVEEGSGHEGGLKPEEPDVQDKVDAPLEEQPYQDHSTEDRDDLDPATFNLEPSFGGVHVDEDVESMPAMPSPFVQEGVMKNFKEETETDLKLNSVLNDGTL